MGVFLLSQSFGFFLFISLISTGRLASVVEYSPSYLQDKLETTSDLITQDLFEKYSEFHPEDFWEPHSFTFSTTSREVVQVEKVEKRYIPGVYLQWKYARLGFDHYIIGITSNSIDVLGPDFRKITSIDSAEQLVSLTVFSRWNSEENCAEVVIPVGTRKGIEIYKLANNRIEKVNEGWQLQFEIKALEYCHVGLSTKLVVLPTQSDYPVNIYNVAVNKTGQVWYHQRIPVSGKSQVAVYELGSESYIAISSETSIIVYGFDNEKGQYVTQQKINLSHPPGQLASFSIAYKHYLASVPENDEYGVEFFGYNGNQYSKEEDIAKVHTSELHALNVEYYRDEHFILSRKSEGKIEILAYDGAKFYKGYECPKDVCFSESDLEKGAGFTIDDTSYYILPTSSKGTQAELLVIKKSTVEALSPLYAQSAGVIGELRTLLERYKSWEYVVTNAKNILDDSLSLTGGNQITGNWILENVESNGVFVQTDNARIQDGSNSSDKYPFKNLTFLEVNWYEQDFLIAPSDIDSKLSSLDNMTKEIKSILKDAIPIYSDKVHVVTGEQRVEGSFTASILQVEKVQTPAINEEDKVSEFIASLVLREKSINIKTSVQFSGYLGVKNLYANTLNDILVKDIARLNKANEFKGSIEFSDEFIVNGNIKTKHINGIDFSKEIIRASDISDVQFVNGLVARKGATVTTQIDGVKIQKDVLDRILLCSIPQKILIPYSFTDILADGSVKINSINGIKFSDFVSSIITTNFDGLIRGHKIVMGGVNADSLWIDGILNSYKFPEDLVIASQKRLVISGYKKIANLKAGKVVVDGKIDGISTNDCVSRMEAETLKCKWTFEEGVVFLDDVSVKGYVAGIKMETFKHIDTLDQYKSSYYPNADIYFEQPVQIRNLKVMKQIGNKSYEEIFSGLLSFGEREVKIKGQTIFQNSITANDIQVNSGMINNVKLDEIFTLSTAQDISGQKTFENEVRFASLYALDTIDGVKLSQLLENAFRLSKARSISSQLSFEEIKCSKIKVDGPINNFVSFATNVAVAAGRSEQVFKEPVKISYFTSDTLKISENLNIGDNNIDDLNFNNWNANRISLSQYISISVPFVIEGSVIALDSVDTERINGVLLSYLDSIVLRSDRLEQTFTSSFETSGSLTVENGQIIFEELNGYNLEQVREDAIPLAKNEEEIVTGDWTFESIIVTSDLTVNGKVCGADLPKLDVDSVRRGESDVHITGETTFLNKVEVKDQLVAETINHGDVFSNIFTLHTAQEISVPIHFEGKVIVEGKLVTDIVNDVRISWLASIYSFKNGSTHVLTSDIDAEGLIESISLNVNELVQGQDIKEFLLNVVNLNEYGKITGHKTFTQPITIEGDLTTVTVNEVEVRDLKSIILKSGNTIFTAPVTFSNDVEGIRLVIKNGDLTTDGRIGELNLKELVSEAAYLNSRKSLGTIYLDNVIIKKNIEAKYLNGIELEKVIRLDKTQSFGKISVKEAIITGKNVNVQGLISGVDILREYENTILKHSKSYQLVTGVKEFKGDVFIKRNFECLGKLQNQIVRLDGDRTITSNIKFTKIVTVLDGFEVDGKVNGYYISQLVADCLTNGRTETITGNWTFNGGVTFKDVVTGDGEVGGYDIDELIDDKKAEAQTAEEDFEAEKLYFKQQCHLLDVLFLKLSRSHVQLEFFELHQSIVLKQSIKNLVHIRAGNLTRILTASENCEIGSFEWDSTNEVFKPGYSSPRLGEISEWESVTYEDLGILVYRSGQSSCSSSQGIFVVTMDANGYFSSKETLIRGNSATALQLIQHEKSGSIFLFVLGQDRKALTAFIWNVQSKKFQQHSEFTLEGAALRFKASPFDDGIGLFYHSEYTVHFSLFQWTAYNKLNELGRTLFVGNNVTQSTKWLIQSFEIGTKSYGFLIGKDSIINSDCNLMAFEMGKSGIDLFQKIKSYSVTSMKSIRFGRDEYLVLLSKDTGIHIYQYFGTGGFLPFQGSPIRVLHGQDMITFNLGLWNYKLVRPFIAVSTGRTIEIIHSNVNGDAAEYPGSNDLCNI